ncbi:hypothetical protein [Nocardia abscessus]|uniref:hypothetical protein n=1 Tax=Nocardia abscessus TaxID=120957 RepID=UPI002457B727|nr:hypothetical protein [Nocardia abscessus]
MTTTATHCAKCGRERKPLRRGLCGACYESNRERQIAYGRWTPDRVDAEPVRAHVHALNTAGVSLRRIPALAQVSRSNLCCLLYGKPGRPPAAFVRRATAERILAVPIPEDPMAVRADHDNVPAFGAQRRLRALVSYGWPMNHLAAELGMSGRNFGDLIHHREQISARRHRAVADLFARLQMQPGPNQRARLYGLKRRWPLPMQWDEEDLDNPDAKTTTRRRGNWRTNAAQHKPTQHGDARAVHGSGVPINPIPLDERNLA